MTPGNKNKPSLWGKIKTVCCCCCSSSNLLELPSEPPRIHQIPPSSPPKTSLTSPPPNKTATYLPDQDMQRLSSPPVMNNLKTTQAANGYNSPPQTPSSPRAFKSSVAGSVKVRSSLGSFYRGATSSKTTIVKDTAIALKRKSASELGSGVSETADKVSFLDLVEWIRSERLSTLPHKGSRWDTVLIRALYFAERLHGFETALKGHAQDTELAAHLGYGHARLLLELGHENSEALDKAFGFLYRCSSSVSSLLARSEVITFSSEIYEQLCMMYSDLLTLVIDVAVRFYKAVHSASGHSASLDMYEIFGDTITAFRNRRDDITKAIWQDAIAADKSDIDEALDVNVLSRWLAPQDRVLATVEIDHTLIELAEFTAVWFHEELAKFIKGDNHSLLINGSAGSGKTTLAAALAERLQRPVARKLHSTVFYSVGAVPSQASSLNVVKALLFQLLAIRVGNMQMYHAVAQAYETARFTADPHQYEDLLWGALEAVLRNPLANVQETVIIVEGLDELPGGQSAGQGLLQRLVHVVGHGKAVRLISLAQNLTLPTGTHGIQRSITSQDTNDDIHEVVLKLLTHSHHFRSKTGRDQETLISRIQEASGGSFLWASIAAELLKLEKTPESFSKTMDQIATQKPSVNDIVARIVTALELTDDAKLLLSWLVNAARPLTYSEIESLFASNPAGTRTERGVDVQRAVRSLAPVLSIREDVVGTRHHLVQLSVQGLLKQGKIQLSVKDQSMDLLLRLLAYAKFSLPERGEPTLDDTDRSPVEHFFQRHQFLEYVIRYWTWHLHQTSVITPGKKTDFKVTPDIQKVFPESTTMAVLEWLCWDDQFPGAQEVEYHEIVGRLRSSVLTEQHPAVLQSYINMACYYEMIQDTKLATSVYYKITMIGRNILSVSHPVVVESAVRFLRMSQSSITTTRTDIMTHREQILLLLVSAYERTYSATSEIVAQTRQQLVELYLHINEREKAEQILLILQGSTGSHEKYTGDASGVDEHLRVSLGKRRSREIGMYDSGILLEDEEVEQTDRAFELTDIDVYMKQIESYGAKKEFALAEQTYLELWQRLAVACRSTLAVAWHAKQIEVVRSYAKFLETQERRTESATLLVSLWRQYEHHEVSFSEQIMSQFTAIARSLKTVSEYAASLSIFKQASSYYRNVRKEDSRSLTEIEEEMIVVSNEALKYSQKETTASTTSESEDYEMFRVLISTKSRAVDSSTLTMAKSITSKYIAQRNFEQAVSVIQTTLERTWSSFLSKSIHEVTLTSTFQKESIELVEQLAQCYIEQRQYERAEDVYVRLFRASITTTKDMTLLEKTKALIIGFYSKRGYTDRVISVYQEILAIYRRALGPSHESTITLLYELAALCRAHARSHPYWIEYYQQIINVLNTNDSKTCHPRALEAAVIVAESYWEERRYSDAVSVYTVLWQTFVHKHKEFKNFSQETFVRSLYERYYQCLEETKADFEVLRNVTVQYRETTRSLFSANSSIAIEATVALARVSQQSESHFDESISLYEEAFRQQSTSKSMTSTSVNTMDMRSALTTLYKRRVFHSQSSSASSETVEKATSIFQEQFAESKKKYSYSHESTMSSLRELSQLYIRQKKTDMATKELTTAVAEVASKETSSQKAYESATSLVQTFQACSLIEQATSIAEELHYQLIAKEKSSKATFSVVGASSASLFFLAVMQYHLRKDLSITLSEIVAGLKAEAIGYWNFKQMISSKASLEKVLVAAAPLRYLLRSHHRTILVTLVENQAVQLFTERDAENVQFLSKDSARFFIVGILEHLGNKKTADFTRTVLVASNKTLTQLIKNNQFREVYDVANVAFKYAQHRKGYSGPGAISRGFGLACQLDGRGENRCPDPELRKKLLQLSNSIVREILKICHEQKINFAQVNLAELNELVALLGEQEDYDTLEALLNDLWGTRDAQRTWPSKVLLNLGRRLICARYLAGHQIKAMRLCEDIAYNLRRVHGIAHPATIETYELLAELYTRTGQYYQKEAGSDKHAGHQAAEHFKKAVLIHEDILRWLLHDGTDMVADEDDDDTASTILAQHGAEPTQPALDANERGSLAKRHLHLLKLAYQRLGSWPKSYNLYEKLNADLFKSFATQLKGADGVEKWQAKGFGAGKAESNEGSFNGTSVWELLTT